MFVSVRPTDIPADDYVDTTVVSGSIRLERRFAGGWLLREVARLGTYDTSFSNTAPSGSTLVGDSWRVSRQQYNAESIAAEPVLSDGRPGRNPLWRSGSRAARRGRAWRAAAGHDAVQRYGRRGSADRSRALAGLCIRPSQPPTTGSRERRPPSMRRINSRSGAAGKRSRGCAAIAMRRNSTTVARKTSTCREPT